MPTERTRSLAEHARDAMTQAEMLAGMAPRNDRWFLESMSRADELVDHDDGCGQCEHQRIMAAVAREMLAGIEAAVRLHIELTGTPHTAMPYHGAMDRWSVEVEARWKASKFVQLWQEELKAGRDPSVAFMERGWEP